jgi:hyperosmotically inducible periplasmic protein
MLRNTGLMVLLVLAMFLGVSTGLAQDADSQQTPSAADNTKINQRDRNETEPTADQQKENPPDRELTRQIRRALVRDKSLSTYAHNVKIISDGGMVTLKGPVRSEEEKQAIEAKAVEVAGQGKVTNEIHIVAGKKHNKVSDSNNH